MVNGCVNTVVNNMSNLEADNLETSVNDETGELVIEPQYIQYLREHNFTIEELNAVHTVESESEPDKAYLVVNITTYDHPKDHPELDVVEHERDVWACSCWSFRQNSNDVSNGLVKPDGSCKHVERVSKVKRAKNDKAQNTLWHKHHPIITVQRRKENKGPERRIKSSHNARGVGLIWNFRIG